MEMPNVRADLKTYYSNNSLFEQAPLDPAFDGGGVLMFPSEGAAFRESRSSDREEPEDEEEEEEDECFELTDEADPDLASTISST
jgi:hypothetical protein